MAWIRSRMSRASTACRILTSACLDPDTALRDDGTADRG
jgi:hypothetical protein